METITIGGQYQHFASTMRAAAEDRLNGRRACTQCRPEDAESDTLQPRCTAPRYRAPHQAITLAALHYAPTPAW